MSEAFASITPYDAIYIA